MASSQAPSSTTTVPIPNGAPLLRSNTTPTDYAPRPFTSDRSLLTPEDAIYHGSPPRKQSAAVNRLQELRLSSATVEVVPQMARRHKDGTNRNGSRRRKTSRTWKKLLWVKQSYPDNYTDQDTFLEHLQRNPRLQPYDFWPLVADSTVIVQHVCSVVIFIVCFVGIYLDRVSPGAVVGWGSFATVLGWLVWDWWLGQETEDVKPTSPPIFTSSPQDRSASSSVSNLIKDNGGNISARHTHSHSVSLSSIQSISSSQARHPPFHPLSPLSSRTSLRLSTAKSALLIYFTLLGLSPILKSLTKSTSSDSIWAMSFLLFAINIFFFDYSTSAPTVAGLRGGGNRNMPASLSTNAALMASTVLASRLLETGQVFSLTLFSIEVFGLFPVFRRYAKQRTWRGHVTLTTLLVLGAGGGVGLILGRGGDGEGIWDFPYKSGLMGVVIGVLITGLAMGGCSWWLIGLQKYKNEIHGPWDPARPVLRRGWDDY